MVIIDSSNGFSSEKKDSNHVSPLEVIASFGKKCARNLNESAIRNLAEGYLEEQLVSYFGTSGVNFAFKYLDSDNESKAYGVGIVILGLGQDLATLYGTYKFDTGSESIFAESCAAMLGLKLATQIGALAYRRYKAEQEKLKNEKTSKPWPPQGYSSIDADLFNETGEVRSIGSGDKK